MSVITLINSTDLEQWSERIVSRSQLSQLIRDLIIATLEKDSIQNIRFPSGDDSQDSGYDGILRVSVGHQFIPEGESIWEFSCSKDVRNKANSDYDKRTDECPEEFRKKTTFVFATLRKWKAKDKWVKEKRNEDQWKSIFVLDAVEIEHWLQIKRDVHLKYSIKLGKHPEGVIIIDDFIENWKNQFGQEVPTDIFLNGRDDEIKRFEDWLAIGDSPLSIQAETIGEAELFSFVTLKKIDESTENSLLTKSLFVKSDQSLLQLTNFGEELYLICSGISSEVISSAERSGHKIILPVRFGNRKNSPKTHIKLPKIPFDETRKRLRQVGFDEKRSIDLAVLARRSYLAFKRKLSKIPEVKPSWANQENSEILLPLIFVEQFNETNEKDQELFEELSETSFSDVITRLIGLKGEEDSPVQNIGGIWYLTSKYDCWLECEEFLTREKRTSFLEETLKLYLNYNEEFDLPIEKRWASAIFIDEKTVSNGVYKGIADTLCMMRNFYEEHKRISQIQEIVRVVEEIFQAAVKDWRLWATLDPILPDLAETSPNSFMTIINTELSKQNHIFGNLFLESKNIIFDRSYHNGILWGIERLAWFPEYLSFATVLLAKIIKSYGDLKLSNQPKETLNNIYFPMFPQTTANAQERLEAIDLIRKRFSDIAWKLMIGFLPAYQGYIKLNIKPNWSNMELRQTPTNKEVSEFLTPVFLRIIEDVKIKKSRWVDLIKSITKIPKVKQTQVIIELENLDFEQMTPMDSKAILAAIRELISTLNSYPDLPRKIEYEQVEILMKIYEDNQPDDLVERYYWLFGNNVQLLEGVTRNWRQDEKRRKDKRIDALKQIVKNEGVQGILQLSKKIDNGYFAGYLLGEIDISNELDCLPLILNLESDNYSSAELSKGFLQSKLRENNVWGKKYLEENINQWSENLISKYILCFPPNNETWNMLNEFDEEINLAYWSNIEVARIRNCSQDEFLYSITNLLKFNRPLSSGTLILENIEHITEKNLAIIDEVLRHCFNVSPVMDRTHYSTKHLLLKLYTILFDNKYQEEQLMFFEWNLLPFYEVDLYVPRILHKKLDENPEYFVEIVCNAYKSKSELAQDLSEENQQIAKFSVMLVESYRGIPKRSDEYDHAYLINWINQVRQGFAKNDRVEVGEILLGQMLSGSPVDDDGCWPHESTRIILDQYSTDKLVRGFCRGVIDSRGGTSRSPTEGGAQEKAIVKKYKRYRVCLASKWPLLATIIDRIILYYQSEAEFHDLRAELRKDLVTYY